MYFKITPELNPVTWKIIRFSHFQKIAFKLELRRKYLTRFLYIMT